MTAATNPTARGPTSEPASPPVSSSRPFQMPAPAMIGTAIRNEKRAAASRVRPRYRPAEIVMPEREMPGKRASACAAPMTTASRTPSAVELAALRADAVGQPQDGRPGQHQDDQEGRAVLPEERVEEALPERAEQRPGDDRDEQQPGQAAVRVVTDAPLGERPQEGAQVAPEVGPEVQQQGDERAHMEHHVERGRVDERVVPAQQLGRDDEVPRRTRWAGTRSGPARSRARPPGR